MYIHYLQKHRANNGSLLIENLVLHTHERSLLPCFDYSFGTARFLSVKHKAQVTLFPIYRSPPSCSPTRKRGFRLKTVQKYKMFGNQQRKLRKNLEGTGKILIFAASNKYFGYPGKFPAGEQDHIDTIPFK